MFRPYVQSRKTRGYVPPLADTASHFSRRSTRIRMEYCNTTEVLRISKPRQKAERGDCDRSSSPIRSGLMPATRVETAAFGRRASYRFPNFSSKHAPRPITTLSYRDIELIIHDTHARSRGRIWGTRDPGPGTEELNLNSGRSGVNPSARTDRLTRPGRRSAPPTPPGPPPLRLNWRRTGSRILLSSRRFAR